MDFIKVGHFGCFDAIIIMLNRGGEYALEGSIEFCRNMKNWKGLSLVMSTTIRKTKHEIP